MYYASNVIRDRFTRNNLKTIPEVLQFYDWRGIVVFVVEMFAGCYSKFDRFLASKQINVKEMFL